METEAGCSHVDNEVLASPGIAVPASDTAASAKAVDELPAWLTIRGRTPMVTAILVANTVAFAAMTSISGIKSMFVPSSQVLLHFGASSGAATIIDGQYWRIFTSAFIHCGLLHLMMNAYVLWDVGPWVEKLFGSRRFICIYAIAALGAALSSLMFNPDVVSVGASGAIFGLFGALMAFFWAHRSDFPSGFLRMHTKIVGIFILYGIVTGVFVQGVDNASHIGGLLFGFIAALGVMPFAVGEASFTRRDAIATAGAAMYCFALLALDCRMVRANRQVEGDAAYRQAIELLQHNQPAQAIPLLNIAIALMPDIASVRWDRARAHVSLGQYDMALQDSNHAVKMEPKNKIALMVRSTVFRSMSDDRHAVEDLSRVLELDPKNAMVYNNRAWSYNALGNYDAALNDATRAIELNRNLSTSYDTRAVAYLMTNRPNEAIADLNKVSRLKRNDASSAYHLAVAYKQLGKTDLAEESTQVAKRLGYKPESWEAKL